MNRRQQQSYKWHSNHDDYKQRISRSLSIIRKCFEKYNPYVAYSGGKDSLVMTHMVLSLYPDTPVWHWDYGDDLMPRQYEEEVLDNLKLLGARNVVVNKRTGSGNDTSSGYKQFFNQIKENKEEYGWDIAFVGVRQQESISRKHKYNKDFKEDCYPIRHLTVDDIWAYIISNNIRYPSHYDIQGDYYGYDYVRFVTFFDPEFQTMNMADGIFCNNLRHEK